ncbi:DUF4268 domain-containing protein [Sphingobacterium oryzagri]|uniref:DUF4268 domain-containing protein n=1 Tax=Sphingobacterium oryzagri TaxID=3025669 RepID=A0ABY7WK69_9SPHI|nr:DUF4268 domain-containing protein [Sphingobacterium sp. KACC 22765]WDF69979.1 DUF4268 domain-containing protein [Sphingobacterium sp. KACC 22765]
MYSREEAKKLKEKFWTSFGQFMSLMPSEEGTKVNWVNYKTGVKHLYFRMEAEGKQAQIFIELAHPDEGIRALMYEQLLAYKNLLHTEPGEEWIWDATHTDEYGKVTARVALLLEEKVSIFKQEDWPKLIAFFKPRLIALDGFWSSAKYGFEIFT